MTGQFLDMTGYVTFTFFSSPDPTVVLKALVS